MEQYDRAIIGEDGFVTIKEFINTSISITIMGVDLKGKLAFLKFDGGNYWANKQMQYAPSKYKIFSFTGYRRSGKTFFLENIKEKIVCSTIRKKATFACMEQLKK